MKRKRKIELCVVSIIVLTLSAILVYQFRFNRWFLYEQARLLCALGRYDDAMRRCVKFLNRWETGDYVEETRQELFCKALPNGNGPLDLSAAPLAVEALRKGKSQWVRDMAELALIHIGMEVTMKAGGKYDAFLRWWNETVGDIGRPPGMALAPAGEFLMGSPKNESGRGEFEQPQHRVVITKPFYISKFEVTQQQYEAMMGNNPSRFIGASRPVENIGWDDAFVFCRRLSEAGDREYRLPTEAEWEYACRAGAKTRYYHGDSPEQLGDYAWYEANSGGETHPVGQKKPNPWGLYDMLGNVWEWCADWFSEGGAAEYSARDPQGPDAGSVRVLRGGSWRGSSSVVKRSGSDPMIGFNASGFRYVALASPYRPAGAEAASFRADAARELEAEAAAFAPSGNLANVRKEIEQAIEQAPSYHQLIRSAAMIVQSACLGKEWRVVAESLSQQKLSVVDSTSGRNLTRYRCMVKRAAYRTKAGRELDLFIEFNVAVETSKGEASRHIVKTATAGLLANVRAPYRDVVSQASYEKGTVIDQVLKCSEVEKEAEKYPVVARVVVTYDLILDRFAELNPRGFHVELNLTSGVDDYSRGTSTLITVASGLDPLETRDGRKWLDGFESRDLLHEMKMWGTGEWVRPSNQKILKKPSRRTDAKNMPSVTIAYGPGDLKTLGPNITRLKVEGDRLSDEDLATLSRFTELKSLDLSECDSLTTACLQYISRVPTLASLTLSGQAMSGGGFHHLANLRNLTDLSVYWCSKLSSDNYREIARLSQLTSLTLWWCTRLTDEDLNELSNLRELQELLLWGCPKITDAGLQHVSTLSNLREVSFSHSSRVTSDGVKQLTKLTRLRKLSLGYMPLGDEVLRHLSKIPSLQSLSLHGLKITDNGLQCLKALSELEWLSITDCPGVTSRAVRDIEKELSAKVEGRAKD